MERNNSIGLPHQRTRKNVLELANDVLQEKSYQKPRPSRVVDKIGIGEIKITQLNTGGFYVYRDFNIGMLTEEERGLVAKMLRQIAREVRAGMPIPDAPYGEGHDALCKRGVN